MRSWRYIVAAAACLLVLVLAGGWVVMSNPTAQTRAQLVEAAQARGSGSLDGMTFSGQIFVDGEPLDVIDTWVFSQGTFESTECSNRCNYPPAPYYVREVGDAVEFVSELHCLDKDAKIVWRGTIENGRAKGNMTWTANRWYWTIEREFVFEGALTGQAASIAGD